MGGLVFVHELEEVGGRQPVEVAGKMGGIAVDMEMLEDPVDDSPGEEGVFHVHPVFPGSASQDDRPMLLLYVAADCREVYEGACDDLFCAAVQGHVQELGAVGRGEDEQSSANERFWIFEGRIAIGEALGYFAISFPGGDASECFPQLDAAMDGGYGHDSGGTVVKGCCNGRGGP